MFPLGRAAIGLIVLGLAGWLASGALTLDMPELKGFNFSGGLTLSPEFAALLAGLVIYTSAFIAEVVRGHPGGEQRPVGSGRLAGPAPSAGAAPGGAAAGAARDHPADDQPVPEPDNSSLAVAIGYPDIVSVVNTTLNQTGQAIEGILIIMAAYLTVSLSISIFMNWYNKRIALVER